MTNTLQQQKIPKRNGTAQKRFKNVGYTKILDIRIMVTWYTNCKKKQQGNYQNILAQQADHYDNHSAMSSHISQCDPHIPCSPTVGKNNY